METESVFSISQLTDSIRNVLNGEFTDIWVSGEISSLSKPQSGHLYLTLKDDLAQLSTVIWRSTAERLNFEPQDGMQVLCRGYIDVYPQRGSYQLIVQAIQPIGLGALQLAFRKLHDRLKQEGLFDDRHKQPLPEFPQRVVVITSPTGAAIQDFLHVVTRRWPHLDVLIVPVKVQGPGAADEIAAAIKMCGGKFNFDPDVIVVTRGGGSIEDLWAFNEENVVRAIHACPLPVVSAVGHEIDVSLSDLAADLRALTPSEAGEKLVPNVIETRDNLNACATRLDRSIQRSVRLFWEQLSSIANRPCIRQPLQITHRLAQQLDAYDIKLNQLSGRKLEVTRQRLGHCLDILRMSATNAIPNARLQLDQIARSNAFVQPLQQVEWRRSQVRHEEQAMYAALKSISRELHQRLEVMQGKLEAFNPRKVLQRGYSLTLDDKGRAIVSCQNVNPGDRIETWLGDGKLASRIEDVEENLSYMNHGEEEN